MDKSLKFLAVTKRILCILCPILLIVGCFMHIAYTYANENTKLTLSVIAGFAVGVFVLALINIISQIIKYLSAKKNNFTYEEKNVSKNKIINKIYNFFFKYENFVSIALNMFILISAILTICLYFGKGIGYYWEVYYYLNILQWFIVLGSTLMVVYSNNKKSLIVNLLTSGINLALTITMCVFSNIMMHGKIGAFTNTLEYNILFMAWGVFALFNLGFICANGKFEDFKMGTNFGFGVIGVLIGTVCLYFTKITKKILSLYTDGDKTEKLFYLNKAHIAIFILLGICFAFFIANLIINSKRHFKNKNWIGVADFLLSFAGIILTIYGVYTFTKFLMYV